MSYYPLFIDMKGKKVLVAGGGKIGTKRALSMAKSEAEVTVIAKDFSALLKKAKKIRLVKKDLAIQEIDLDGTWLLITATSISEINEKLAKQAKKHNVLVNRADKKDAEVIFPAVEKRGKNIFAFSTLGKNPKLSRRIKEVIRNELSAAKA